MNKTIGWIGLGKMGMPMVQQLLNAEYSVSFFARSTSARENLEMKGAKAVHSVRELAHAVDILFLMVTDDVAVDELFNGSDGILESSLQDKIIVNMSTVSPRINIEMAEVVQAKGGNLLDAPVSGSVLQAENATLVIMVGGDIRAYERIRPVLNILGSNSIYIGKTGSGNMMKLAINALLGIQAQGLAEVFNFAEDHGLPGELVLQVINNSVFTSPFFRAKGMQVIANNYKPSFALGQMVKDLRLIQENGWTGPIGNVAIQYFGNARAQFGDEDVIAIKKYLGS